MDFVDGDYFDGFSIATVSGFDRKKLREHDVGLYVLRKKASGGQMDVEAMRHSKIILGEPQTYFTHNPWHPVFGGQLIAEPGRHARSVSGDIHFYNPTEEPRYYLFNKAAAQTDLHVIPRTLTFSFDWQLLHKTDWEWNWRDKNTTRAFKLYTSEKESVWLNLHDGIDDLFFEVEFDEAETVNAFQHLDGDNKPVKLEIILTPIEKYSAAMTVTLRNGNKSAELKQAAIRYKLPDINNENIDQALLFELSKLKYEYEKALKDNGCNPARFLQ